MKTYVIGDMHLGHENILVYEPDRVRVLKSETAANMNYRLIQNWNSVVEDEDVVFHLGDFAFGRGSKEKVKEWVGQLRGQKIWIRGNHFDPRPNIDCALIHKGDIRFVLIHNPANQDFEVPKSWTIHAHAHSKLPYLDPKLKRVNVSAEVIGYKPKDLNEICNQIMEIDHAKE